MKIFILYIFFCLSSNNYEGKKFQYKLDIVLHERNICRLIQEMDTLEFSVSSRPESEKAQVRRLIEEKKRERAYLEQQIANLRRYLY